MKRKILLFICGIAVISAFVTGTYSFRTRETRTENIIRTGSIDLAILQTDENGDSVPVLSEGILPGDTVKRSVTLENTGSKPLYLRVKIKTNTAENNKNLENCLKLDINTEMWMYKDGYYYYLSDLSPGEITEPLFSTVRFEGKEIDNSFIGEKIGLSIVADAVQSENNGDGVFGASGFGGGVK